MQMTTISSVQFIDVIRDRVTDIRSALFFNMGETPAIYSAGIISALEVDNEGYIFFFINRPEYLMREDRRFPSRLEFYRKGKPYFLKVNGVAELITDQESMDPYFQTYGFPIDADGKKLALVKVKVQQVEYNEPEELPASHILKKFSVQVSAWFSLR
jgi:Pyridoxamine 5'-phosphate oxidase like